MVVKIGLIQMRCSNDPIANLAAAMENIRQAAAQGAQILCLPELFKTLYFCQAEEHAHFNLAEKVPGPTTERLGALARELEIVLIVPLFERRAPGSSPYGRRDRCGRHVPREIPQNAYSGRSAVL